MTKRIYIIAGEASGDLHGGNLVRELFKMSNEWRVASGESDPSTASVAEGGTDSPLATHHSPLLIRAWGGDRMAAAGAEVVKHYRDLAFMGFTQVLLNLRTIIRNLEACKRDIVDFRPDALVLIDYPGFNLRIAEWAHGKGIPVHYYISPQVWAWKEGRVRTIRKVVDHMYVILPFEKDWYAQRGMTVEFVGHPLLDAVEQEGKQSMQALPSEDGRPVVALLPGSRIQEISRMLPVMVNLARRCPDYHFVVAAAPSVPAATYAQAIGDAPVTLVQGRTYDVLRKARAALVTSGTATLETALFGVPLVVCYKASAINVWLAKRLVNIRFISLVNLIMDREVVKELIQSDLNVERLEQELHQLVGDTLERSRITAELGELRTKLGGPGASRKVALAVWKSLVHSA